MGASRVCDAALNIDGFQYNESGFLVIRPWRTSLGSMADLGVSRYQRFLIVGSVVCPVMDVFFD